jgi:hypothetical protein
MAATIAWAMAKHPRGSAANHSAEPVPEDAYGVFNRRHSADLVTFETVLREDESFARVAHGAGLGRWALSRVIFSNANRYQWLICEEEVGGPIALHAYARNLSPRIGILCHGKHRSEGAHLRILRDLPNVVWLCPSDRVREIMIVQSCCRPEQTFNIGWGVDTTFFRKRSTGANAESPVVTVLEDGIDVETLLRSLAGTRIRLEIGWEGTAPPPSMADTSANVQWTELTSASVRRDLYARAAFVVAPVLPLEQACGQRLIAEAMASGKAVLTSGSEARNQMVVEGKSGFSVRPGDAGALRAAMLRMLADPLATASMGDYARQVVEERCSLEQYCDQLELALGMATVEQQAYWQEAV